MDDNANYTAREISRRVAIETIRETTGYSQGYREGFIEGRNSVLSYLTDIISLSTTPMIIKLTDEQILKFIKKDDENVNKSK